MLQLKRRHVSKAATSKREVSAASFIPYKYHWDKETLITKSDELLQIVKIEGFSFETADDDDVDMKKMVRNSLYKSMADATFAFTFHMIRRNQHAYPGGMQPEGFADFVDMQWKQKHSTQESYINELYITVIRKKDNKGAAKVENLFKSIEQSADKKAKTEEMREMHKELKESVYRLLATFKDYGARVLTTKETPYGPMSEPLEFLGYLVNGGQTQKMLAPTMDISRYIPFNRPYFGSRAIEFRGASHKRYGAIISLKEYAPQTAAGMLDAFLQLPFEFIISQSYTFENRQSNIGSMQIQQNKMLNAGDVAVSQIAEISDALDMAMSGHIGFGTHHLTVLCLEDSLPALEKAVSMAIAELVNIGVNPVREKLVMEQCFWAQLPANFAYIGRKAKINTLNISGFASMHNYPVGQIADNHWGDAVTVFDTSSGTPFFFNFHLRDVGHTMIIGPTGAGKTVLMNFLCAQAQKFNCRMFLFDKDRGSDIFVRALDGRYSLLDPSKKCHFNPLQLPDTLENRTFLVEWLRAMLTINDEDFSADDLAMLQNAVDGSYKLDQKDRVLCNIAPFLGMETPGSLAGRLKMWYGEGQYAGLFDNDIDQVNFSENRNYGFEMGYLLEDKASLVPTLLYLFHRIQLSLDGTPTMIVLDEAWALIDNKVFSKKIKDWLKTLRKLNGMVIFATQSVEDATASAISDTLVQQTSTQIFLPNQKATATYRNVFMLSEREFNLLKTTDPGSRYFLVKQGKDVVVARIDLSGMDDVINVLSGRAETVLLCDEIRAETGDDPEEWMPLFFERLRSG